MEFIKKQTGSKLSCKISGQLTYLDHDPYREFLSEFKKSEMTSIVFDIVDLQFVDSAGMGLILLTVEECKKIHCSVTFESPKGQVLRMFKLAKLSTIATITDG